MKLQYITTLAAVVVVVAAKPHHYMHRRAHDAAKRNARADSVVYVPAATVTSIVYWLDGHSITEEDVRQGIANGTLMWGEDGALSSTVSIIRPISLATPAPASDSATQATQEAPNTGAVGPASLSPEPEKASSTSAAQPTSPAQESGALSVSWADLVDQNGYCASCDKEFPSGTIPCDEFPYGYGALPLAHEGLGGWSGIQDPQYSGGDGFDDITTVVKGSCSDGSCCTAGSFCSYGCPNPYLKLSFPKKQGRTGQSVGGLYCNSNGYLEMADGSIGKTLCGQSSKSMTVKVKNKLSKSVSFCRTDYPGKSHISIWSSSSDFSQVLNQ